MSLARYALILTLLMASTCSHFAFAQSSSTLTAISSSDGRSSGPSDPILPVIPTISQQHAYRPLGVLGKFGRFARNSYGPDIFLFGAATAGKPDIITIPHKPVAPPNMTPEQSDQYDLALQNYETKAESARDRLQEELRWRGRRFLAGMAQGETQAFLQNFMLPVIWRQDPRYFKAEGYHGVGYRMLYALSRVAVARSDSGHSVVNYSRLMGAAGAAAAARYYYFDSLDVSHLATSQHMLKTIGGSLALDGVFNIVREFWPQKGDR